MDDSILKRKTDREHLSDLEQTFNTLRKYKTKFNPNKCVFGVTVEKFLGFIISKRGMDANPDKVCTIMDLLEPKSVKDFQRLKRRIAALTQFISKLGDKPYLCSCY